MVAISMSMRCRETIYLLWELKDGLHILKDIYDDLKFAKEKEKQLESNYPHKTFMITDRVKESKKR